MENFSEPFPCDHRGEVVRTYACCGGGIAVYHCAHWSAAMAECVLNPFRKSIKDLAGVATCATCRHRANGGELVNVAPETPVVVADATQEKLSTETKGRNVFRKMLEKRYGAERIKER